MLISPFLLSVSAEKTQSVVGFCAKVLVSYLRYGDNSDVNVKHILNQFELCVYCKTVLRGC